MVPMVRPERGLNPGLSDYSLWEGLTTGFDLERLLLSDIDHEFFAVAARVGLFFFTIARTMIVSLFV